jgi:hypothetical protein
VTTFERLGRHSVGTVEPTPNVHCGWHGPLDGLDVRLMVGLDVGPSEDGAFWPAFLRSLVARGLSGVKLVTSDSHQGLKSADRGRAAGLELAALPPAIS